MAAKKRERRTGGVSCWLGCRAGIGCFLGALTVMCVLGGIPSAAAQDARAPLFMPGKSSLFQRVLTRPGAALYAAPGGGAVVLGEIPALSIFFVYDRKPGESVEWLELGQGSRGPSDGWVRAETTIEWKQTLTVAFTNPANRERALFFSDRDYLLDLIGSERMVGTIDSFRETIAGGDLPSRFPVISIEPPTHVDLTRNFYLLPILGFEDAYFETGFKARVLKVAAATLDAGEADVLASGTVAKALPATTELLKDYRTGVVFVIDTTSSMGPYIDRTRETVRRIYQRLAASEWGRNLSFGLVAFRDNVAAAPGLEYLTRTYATLADGLDLATFFEKVDRVEPATVSSRGFNEDPYAGLLSAMKKIDWSDYGGRFIVLITDAGARRANDALGATGRGADQIRTLAREKGIAIYALHLLTREGRHTHEMARAQHRSLALSPGVGELYFGIDEGSVKAFGAQVDEMAESLVAQIAAASEGKLIEVSTAPEKDAVSPEAAIKRKTELVGRAMQLAYLGRKQQAKAPRLFSAWIADRDFIDQAQKTLEVRVLITKNQLSDLQQTLSAILEIGDSTRIKPLDFFDQLRSAAAVLSRNPDSIGKQDVRRLADVGLLGEYLEGLPYRSKIMEITEDDWLRWSFTQQREFLDELEAKIMLYQDYHDDTDLWIALDGGRVKGDAVYPVLLEALP